MSFHQELLSRCFELCRYGGWHCCVRIRVEPGNEFGHCCVTLMLMERSHATTNYYLVMRHANSVELNSRATARHGADEFKRPRTSSRHVTFRDESVGIHVLTALRILSSAMEYTIVRAIVPKIFRGKSLHFVSYNCATILDR